MLIKIILLLLFFGSMIAVGLYARKSANSMTDFVLGGRSVGPWLSAFAYGTSYFSAVVFVGYAGQFGWKYGLASTWIGLGNAVIGSLLAWVAMGRRTRVMTHHLEVATMPDFFGQRYDSNVIKIAASAIAFVFMIPYTASVYNGLSRLFGMAFDIPYTVCYPRRVYGDCHQRLHSRHHYAVWHRGSDWRGTLRSRWISRGGQKALGTSI